MTEDYRYTFLTNQIYKHIKTLIYVII